MRTNDKQWRVPLTVAALVATLALGLLAGRQLALMGLIDSPGTPGNTLSYTLDDIYDRLDSGDPGAQSTFTEPAAAPGGTMRTLDEIMALIPDHKNSFDGADGEQVIPIPDGIYEGGKTATANDSDLKPGNVVWNTEIFGVTGRGHVPPATGVTRAHAAGDDGDYEYGRLPAVAPCQSDGGCGFSREFIDNGNGTVTDGLTGLMWAKDANLWGKVTWEVGISNCNDLVLGGESDWRMPNFNELMSICDPERTPALGSSSRFTNVQSGVYFSSSGYCDGAWCGGARGVWDDGRTGTYGKTPPQYVWPVRGP